MKRSFSLLELMIALSLFSLLIGTLFFWYHRLSLSQHQMKESGWSQVEERYCLQRLEKIFSSANGFFATSDLQLSTLSSGSLVFTFDRGIATEPELCGTVLARLYHDPQYRQLCLGIWPTGELPKREPMQTYTLLADVDAMEFSFYEPPPEDLDQIPRGGWHKRWLYPSLPALMKMKLIHEGQEVVFGFDLQQPIRYRR